MSRGWLCAAALATVLLPATARAGQDDSEVAHEGLYIRLTGGVAYSLGSVQKADGSGSGLARGGGGAFQLSIGGTPYEGLAVGVILAIPSAVSAHVGADGVGGSNMSMLGLFADYYPDATAGLHVGLAGGYAVTNYGSGEGRSIGPGGLAFAGYDLWIGDSWSLCAMLQLHGQLGWGGGNNFGDRQAYRMSGVNIMAGSSLQVGILFN